MSALEIECSTTYLSIYTVRMYPRTYKALIRGYNYDQAELLKEYKDLTKLMSHAQ